ncbi:hypothetical protein NBRC13296_28545 [Paenibacillus chitinolyticus]|uniref:hypothetical protein n=1 Tax=Paenibacillus chitinolyticus TaxID=79263 RepID=UPI003556800F
MSDSERENKQSKLIDSIKRSFEKITVGKFVSLSLSEDFNADDANLFLSFLSESIESLPENTDLQFPPQGSPKIVFALYPPNKIELQHLTVGTSGNLEWIETTGEAQQQVKNSLSKAIGAFLWNSDEKNINIIAMEADRYDDIDISQAVFGTEKFLFYKNGSNAWTRKVALSLFSSGTTFHAPRLPQQPNFSPSLMVLSPINLIARYSCSSRAHASYGMTDL